MQSLLITIQNRPYVVAFLLAFLIISLLNRGFFRTVLFLVIGYSVAFVSEFCSIRWGFPYGMYHYLYENMPGELILGGVPVWDSISYVFMAYASYETASWIKGKFQISSTKYQTNSNYQNSKSKPFESLKHWNFEFVSDLRFGLWNFAFPAFLMTLLDIVTDPLAVRGNQWFLGKIFYYPEEGIYFGVPLSNFAGWFLVGFCIFGLYRLTEEFLHSPSPPRKPILGPLFYFSIMLFNIVITFWIQEWGLALASGSLLLVLFGIVAKKLRQKNRQLNRHFHVAITQTKIPD